MKCIEVFEEFNVIYIVTEFCHGGDLKMYLEKRGFDTLWETKVKELAEKIA